MKKSLTSIIAITTLLAAGPLMAQNQPKTSTEKEKAPHTAASFIKNAAEGNLAEVQLGQLAQQKSQNAQVKEFGQRLVQDHTQANQKLETLAKSENVTWPTQPDKRDQRLMQRFEKLSGSEFDQQFVRHAIRDHARDIAKYDHAANNLQDNALKSYAQDTLPTLREHLKLAEQLGTSLGLSKQNISSLERPLHHRGMGAPGSTSGSQQGSTSGSQGSDWNKNNENK